MSFPGYLFLKMKILFAVWVFAETNLMRDRTAESQWRRIESKDSWRTLLLASEWGSEGHFVVILGIQYIYLFETLCVCPSVCVLVQKPVLLVRLCGRLPALSHIIADSVVYRGGGREPDTAPPFGSLCTNTHTHTLYQSRQKAYLTRSGHRKGDEGWRKRWSKWALLISPGFILRIFQIIPEQMSWSYGVLG